MSTKTIQKQAPAAATQVLSSSYATSDQTRKPYSACHPKLWAIHGQYYDLTAFIDKHPGGAENMLLGRGRDCTELFESVHSLSKLQIHKILDKYKVDTPVEGPPPPEEIFTWKKDGFYAVLKERVAKHFEQNTGGNHKATWGYWVKVWFLFFLWFGLFRHTMFTGNPLTALVAGFLMNMLGFNVMHDGSHYGISKRVWINRALHTLWSDWNLWSHFIWLRHHVYGHHSYTGIFRRDPDLVNVSLIVRKTADLRHQPIHKTQHWHTWLLLTLVPNQHLGQALLYLRGWFAHAVFGLRLDRPTIVDFIVSAMIYIPSLYVHFVLPFYYLPVSAVLLASACYWTAQGIGYYLNIIPNHDTKETHDQMHIATGEKRDWGVQQVLGSGNHSTGGGLWSMFVASAWGGMCYQIEHHLFPSVSHVHFPAISKIVQQTCKEFSVPYVTHSWFHAFVSFGCLLKALSFKGEYKYAKAE